MRDASEQAMRRRDAESHGSDVGGGGGSEKRRSTRVKDERGRGKEKE